MSPPDYDNDPVVKKIRAECFNNALEMVLEAVAMSFGETIPPDPTISVAALSALIERLQVPVPIVPESTV